jgi:hypothetical protein
MDQQQDGHATSSLKARSTNSATEDHVREEDSSQRDPTASTGSTVTAVDSAIPPGPSRDSVELEPRSPVSAEDGANPAITVVVPKPQRRGLFARYALIAEIGDPRQYSHAVKWSITFLVAFAAAAAPMGSAIFFRTCHPSG